MSSLMMALCLLLLGSLLLHGLNRQQRSLLAQVSSQSRALRESAAAHSALQWGRVQRWPPSPSLQCRLPPGLAARVCLRIFGDGSLLLIARGERLSLWQAGDIIDGEVRFRRHGWSDFCPLQEAKLCQIP